MKRNFILGKFLPALLIIFVGVVIWSSSLFSWGFYSHRLINKMAVFTLPPQMIGFYKNHIEYIYEHAIDPDKRTFSDENEGMKHYIDIDHYGVNPCDSVPHKWKDAVAKYTEDTLNEYGINPWTIEKTYYKLVEAFKEKDVDKILWTSANLGHYIADGCTPLHHTEYYDGKTTDQKGIHAFWETRIPELFAEDYDFFVGQAEYIEKVNEKIWEFTKSSSEAVDTIFLILKKMDEEYPGDKKYTFENRGQTTVKVVTKEYAQQFSTWLGGMVEKRMRLSVKMVGSFWYTAWVNAGQPDLTEIEAKEISDAHKKELEETEKMWKTGKAKGRPNPDE